MQKDTRISGRPRRAIARIAASWAWLAWLGGFLALVAATLALVANARAARSGQEQAQWWRTHTLSVLIDAERMDTALNKALRGERGYVLTGRPGALATYRQGLSDYASIAGQLLRLTADNHSQQRRLAELDRRVRAFTGAAAPVVARMNAGETGAAMAAARTGHERESLEQAGTVLDAVKAEERRLLGIREASDVAAAARIRQGGRIMLWLMGGLLLLVAAATAAMLRAARTARENGQQYRLLADNATDVVLRTDVDGYVAYVSPSCVELSGYAPGELIARHCGEFIHPEDAGGVHEAHVALVDGRESRVTVEYRLQDKAGGWRWLESHMQAWRAPGDATGGVISAIRDITRRKELETELVAARDKAEGAARVKATFLANMSHEIRTPMNGVLGFTELVLSGDLDADQRRHVELIAESGRSMMRLLNDILDVSKIESGKMRVTAEPLDLRHIVRRCADLMAPAARAKGVTLSAAIDPCVPFRIVGDPLRLRQVLLNLLGNAVKFTGEGAITVEASVDGEALRIDVADTGIGIAPERLDAIFDQFAQADDSTARLYGGTGLGLSISGELARLMGGTIAVHSIVGESTVFTVRLPLRVTEHREAASDAGLPAPQAGETAARRPRVLIAEDHDINQELIVAMARRAGMDPELAADGAAAIAMVEQAERAGRPFELVLMDMQMPTMDGLEATRRLRAAGRSADALPIVALTANAYAEDVQACIAAGMQAHLAKPVRVRDLTAVLARFVRPDTAAAAGSTAVSPKLLDRYRARKAETGRMLDELAALDGPGEQAMAAAAGLLHKLAGVAALFGEAELGERARRLEEDMLACPAAERAARARAAAATFRAAA